MYLNKRGEINRPFKRLFSVIYQELFYHLVHVLHQPFFEIWAVCRFDEGQLELELACDEGPAPTESSIARFDQATNELIDEYTLDPTRAWVRIKKTPAPA